MCICEVEFYHSVVYASDLFGQSSILWLCIISEDVLLK